MELSFPRRSARIPRLGAKQGAHSLAVDQAVNVTVASGTTSRSSRMDTPRESQADNPDAPSVSQPFVTGLNKRIVKHGHVRNIVMLCGVITTVFLNLLPTQEL